MSIYYIHSTLNSDILFLPLFERAFDLKWNSTGSCPFSPSARTIAFPAAPQSELGPLKKWHFPM
jgi:hypothetical protein